MQDAECRANLSLIPSDLSLIFVGNRYSRFSLIINCSLMLFLAAYSSADACSSRGVFLTVPCLEMSEETGQWP